MGSWSVYCGISHITISAGHKMVLLPIKVNERDEGTYLPHLPATLSIFGEYDDYGGIENIEENENTKMIEEHFGISILEFTQFFTDYVTYERNETDELIEKLKSNGKYEEIKDWKFMFIDRQVYDFLSNAIDSDYYIGHFEFGNPGILKMLGAEYIGEQTDKEINKCNDPERFKYHWKLQGRDLWADGAWCHIDDNKSCFNILGDSSSLESLGFEISEEWKEHAKKSSSQIWKYYDYNYQKNLLTWIIGNHRDEGTFDFMDSDEYWDEFEEIIKNKTENKSEEEKAKIKEDIKLAKQKYKNKKGKLGENPSLKEKYVHYIDKFGDELAALCTIRHNMHSFSGFFTPYVLYVTTQCSEFDMHQQILNKFVEINGTYIYNE